MENCTIASTQSDVTIDRQTILTPTLLVIFIFYLLHDTPFIFSNIVFFLISASFVPPLLSQNGPKKAQFVCHASFSTLNNFFVSLNQVNRINENTNSLWLRIEWKIPVWFCKIKNNNNAIQQINAKRLIICHLKWHFCISFKILLVSCLRFLFCLFSIVIAKWNCKYMYMHQFRTNKHFFQFKKKKNK